MKIVILRIFCAAVILIIIAITNEVLQTLGEKGINIFSNHRLRWCLSFIIGILLGLLGANFFLA